MMYHHSTHSDPYVKVTLKRKNKSVCVEQTKKKKKVSSVCCYKMEIINMYMLQSS